MPLQGEAKTDKSLCAKYTGCQSAATVGNVRVIVFKSATAAQANGSSTKGAEIEKAGGRRHWSLVEYLELGPDERAAWRDVQRAVFPS